MLPNTSSEKPYKYEVITILNDISYIYSETSNTRCQAIIEGIIISILPP